MTHLVDVHTIKSKGTGTERHEPFMHVESDYGYVSVHTLTSDVLPTFLVSRKYVVEFIQFSDVHAAKDYFTYNQAYIQWIKRIDYSSEADQCLVADDFLELYLIDEDDNMYPGRLDQRVTDSDRMEEIEELLGNVLVHLDKEEQESVEKIIELLREMR